MLSQSRRANAFATEFLLPRETVVGVRPDEYVAIDQLADRYGVSHKLVKTHARNVENDPVYYWG